MSIIHYKLTTDDVKSITQYCFNINTETFNITVEKYAKSSRLESGTVHRHKVYFQKFILFIITYLLAARLFSRWYDILLMNDFISKHLEITSEINVFKALIDATSREFYEKRRGE